ncbi:MAG: ROK family protein [Coriobacteriales bacterium]|nr:ROK family protein [Coriobacteriales bacterium]
MAKESFDFRSWIRGQRHVGYAADLTDDDHFVLTTDYVVAQINFYNMEPDPEVVELHIEEKATGEAKFFLHFIAQERDHAIQLFREMVQALLALREQQTTEVLLCCTVGMTTSFFAEKLNQVAEAMELDWHFSAVAVSEAIEQGRDKTAVLVAPQIGYQTERMRGALPEVPVLAIPTTIFASYDAAGCVEWLHGELASRKRSAEQRALEHLSGDLVNDKRILVIAAHGAPKKVTITYRLYDHGKVKLDREVIKRTLALTDLTDIIDTINQDVCSCTGGVREDAIGIAIPGSLNRGMFNLSLSNLIDFGDGDLADRMAEAREFDIGRYFNDRYPVPVFFCNNSNAAALGWYGSQDEYQNVAFHSQAVGWPVGGQGYVVNGRIVEGAHGIAGEIRFIADRFVYRRPLHFNAYAYEDVLEMVGQMLATTCATYDPEVIALRCDMLPNMEEVAEELAKYIPRDSQPKLVHVDNYNECILLGMMIRCLQRLAEGNGKDCGRSWKLSYTPR